MMLFEVAQKRLLSLELKLNQWQDQWGDVYQRDLESRKYHFVVTCNAWLQGSLHLFDLIVRNDLEEDTKDPCNHTLRAYCEGLLIGRLGVLEECYQQQYQDILMFNEVERRGTERELRISEEQSVEGIIILNDLLAQVIEMIFEYFSDDL